MPPSRRPSSSHSSRPAHHSSHTSHSSHHSSSSYHRRPSYHSGYSRPSSGSGFLSGLLLGSHMSQQNQSGGQTIINNNYAPQQPAVQQYDCPYCGSRVSGVPSQNGFSSLSCPNCGGALQANNAVSTMPSVGQAISTPSFNSTPTYQASPSAGTDYRTLQARQGGCVTKLIGFIFVIVIIGVILFVMFMIKGTGNSSYNYSNDNNYNYSYSHEDSIYVSVLGRTVYWDDEYDSYYDRDTDCYFFLNQDMNPPVWQYWFEGVSSKYGSNYGWMEWDDYERCWYVQTGSSTWKKLPENEYTNYLWHMD